MNTYTRPACALLTSLATGCANFEFSYVDDSVMSFVAKDIGSECETDDPVDTETARAHVEQVGQDCVITGDQVVKAIEYDDVKDFLDDVNLEPAGFQSGNPYWRTGGICWRSAEADEGGTAYEKCDYRPTVMAEWRGAGEGEDAWSDDPELPNSARANIYVAFFSDTTTASPSLDSALSADTTPALVYSTDGITFPGGPVFFDHQAFVDEFETAFLEGIDLHSLVNVQVSVPMADIGEFTENEYRVRFEYQMYMQGAADKQSLLNLWLSSLGGGAE